jgi:hypothetical protein
MFTSAKQPSLQSNRAKRAHLLIVKISAVAGLALLQACTPAFNWRDVAFEGLPVTALLPCKPDRGERALSLLALGGVQRQMVMAGCKAGDAMFTVAVVDVQDATKVDAVKAELKAANKATQSQYFSHGAVVVQASVYGTPSAERDGPGALSTQAVETFFTGVKLAGKP